MSVIYDIIIQIGLGPDGTQDFFFVVKFLLFCQEVHWSILWTNQNKHILNWFLFCFWYIFLSEIFIKPLLGLLVCLLSDACVSYGVLTLLRNENIVRILFKSKLFSMSEAIIHCLMKLHFTCHHIIKNVWSAFTEN